MPSTTFQRTDTRYFAAALAEHATHAGIGTFEMSLGLATEGNKAERANQVVSFIFAQTDTDALLLSLLNYLYVENPYADSNTQRDEFTRLKEQVLDRRGVVLTDNGYALADGGDIDSLVRVERQPVAPTPVDRLSGDFWSSSSAPSATHASAPNRDLTKVFVVHGRDMRPVAVVRQFLQFLGLHMMSWPEAVALTGQSQPHTYDVVRAGMDGAAAILVIFSPDDLARVKDEYSHGEDDPDRYPQGQPRQNVLLEAGMAFAIGRERTVFVKTATTREISDIAGFNWVSLNGVYDSRLDLKGRLTRAGAAVRAGEYDLTDALAGPFLVR